MSERTPQFCDNCKEIDTHPRHTVYDVDAQQTTLNHFDCCASNGCKVCLELLARIPVEFRRGDALVAYMTKEDE